MTAKMAASESNETKFGGYMMKICSGKHYELLSFDEESYIVPKTDLHIKSKMAGKMAAIWTTWDKMWSWDPQNSLTRHYNDYKNLG